MEQRPVLKLEAAVLGPVYLGTGEVGGQQVRGELHAMKITLYAIAEHLDCARLGESGCALDEQVTVRQYRDQQPFNKPVLTDYFFANRLL